MKMLVIDGSIALGFVLKDEQGALALKAFGALETGVAACVPAHWSAEVGNGLIMAERRKRASQSDITEAQDLIFSLPITIDDAPARRVAGATTALARQYGLTVYDAAYLELAMRKGATLATADKALAKAAQAAGVPVLK